MSEGGLLEEGKVEERIWIGDLEGRTYGHGGTICS